MKKAELIKHLKEGVVRAKIDGEIRQFTRNASKTGLMEDGDLNVLTDDKIKAADDGATIGVYELGTGKLTTITNKDMNNIIGTLNLECCE